MKVFKRMTAVLLVTVMTVSLIACGDSAKDSTQVSETSTEQSLKNTGKKGGSNLLKNGDMSKGDKNYGTYCYDGVCINKVNDKEEMQVDISDIGSVAHGVQLYYDGFKLYEGGVYRFSFDVYGTVARDMEVRFQINGGDYHAYYEESVGVTEDVQTISVEFTMEETSDPAPRLCFNMGKTQSMTDNGNAPEGKHSIMLDNLVLEVVDDSNMVAIETNDNVPKAKINQLGYKVDDEKIVVFSDLENGDNTFTVVNVDSNEKVFDGKMSETVKNLYGDEMNSTGDFSELTAPGKYKVVTSKGEESFEFEIGDDVYQDEFVDITRMLYLQRCGQELTKEEAGDFAHAVCHNTEATIYGTDKKIDVTGGWHDAGDYGRYVVPGAKTVADLLLANEFNSDVFTEDTIAVLDEAKYELDWMLKMQDAESGGVYHKVTCKTFPGTVMPEEETDELIVSPISKTATADFAAVMAMASRVYGQAGQTEFADTCLAAAERAWAYFLEHKYDPGFENPKDIVTGEYPDGSCKDEYFWAAAELYKTTGKNEYKIEMATAYQETIDANEVLGGLGWTEVSAYGAYAALTTDLLLADSSNLYNDIERSFFEAVDEAMEVTDENPYMVCRYESFEWGSNMGIANTGCLFYMANKIKPKEEYVKYAKYQLNYLLGVNAVGYCFVTGKGSLYPQNPHHRPSQVAKKAVPGMLVGGVNFGKEDPYAAAVLSNAAKEKCYVDSEQSYATNEICIYWNSPLIFLMAANE